MRELIAGMLLGYLSFSPKGKELVDSLVCKLSDEKTQPKDSDADENLHSSKSVIGHQRD